MESKARRSAHLLAPLMTQPQTFEFFQAVRIIKKYLQLDNRHGILHFKSHPSLIFPSADIANFHFDRADHSLDEQFTFFVSFLGLTGQSGVLPDHYTEILLERLNQKDSSMEAFLNIFHHRLIHRFYEIWERGHFFVEYERNKNNTLNQGVLAVVRSLSGQAKLKSNSILFDELFIFYSGSLSLHTRPNEALRIILSDHFEVPVVINNYIPEWIEIDQAENHRQLGIDTILGRRICHVQNHFEIQIGPVNYKKFLQLLPSGEMLKRVREITSSFVGQEFDFHIKLILEEGGVPNCETSSRRLIRLGWNSFLKTKAEPSKNIAVRLYLNSVYDCMGRLI